MKCVWKKKGIEVNAYKKYPHIPTCHNEKH